MERNPLIVVGTPHESDGGRDLLLENWRRAVDTGLGCVIIDSDEDQFSITEKAAKAGAYVYVNPDRDDNLTSNYTTESGAERVAASVNKFDRFYNHDIIINVYATLPTIAPDLIKALMYPLANMDVDVATLAAPLNDSDRSSDDTVKVDVEWHERTRVHVLTNSRVGKARHFSRDISEFSNDATLIRHVPIYAYKRASLDRFVRFEPTIREMEERIEPDRALANGMRVDAIMVEDVFD